MVLEGKGSTLKSVLSPPDEMVKSAGYAFTPNCKGGHSPQVTDGVLLLRCTHTWAWRCKPFAGASRWRETRRCRTR